MKKKTLGIGDIAKKLNVSVTTVSFILNGKAAEKRISGELTKKVLKFVEEVGYVPNLLAKSLRTGKSKIIGLIVEDIANPFFASVARNIEEEAYRKGYKIFYCSSENDPDKTKDLIKLFRERQVDGYIIAPAMRVDDQIKSLIEEGCHVILFDRFPPGIESNYVIVDNVGGTYDAITHLLKQGYKNIALITLYSEQSQMKGRLQGYKKALNENHRKFLVKKVKFHDDNEKAVLEIISFLQARQEIDAVFFATNYLALSGLEALSQLGYKIQDDIGVASFDDHDLFRFYSPSITAVAQPMEEMSKSIIDTLLHELHQNERSADRKQIVLPTKLIIRQSSYKKSNSRT